MKEVYREVGYLDCVGRARQGVNCLVGLDLD